MASSNQLRARVPPDHIEKIEDVSEDRDIGETEAERAVVRAGLIRLGYLDENDTVPESEYLRRVRMSGMSLGLTGLIAIGYGLFGISTFRYIGFGVLLCGFALIAGAEFAPVVDEKINAWSSQGDSE